MRLFPPAPEGDDVPVHVLVRECPEVLAVLRRGGVEVAAVGSEGVSALTPAVRDGIVRTTAWRAGADG